VTVQPTTWPARSLKLAIALRDFVSTAFLAGNGAHVALDIGDWFLSASASMPVFKLIFTSFGTWCLFLIATGLRELRNTCST